VDTQRFRRLEELFLAAAELPEHKRAKMLDEACGDDLGLRDSVERLLAHDNGDARFLSLACPVTHAPPVTTTPPLGETPLPSWIGGFHIKGRVGSGGMGVVYLAEQEKPRRDVAIKVMRFEFPSDSARKRFEAEAHTLARMRHPGIAQVYAVGVLGGGAAVPYIAMEYVPAAEKLLDYAQKRGCSREARLRLFLQVCEAVQHAHQQGIVHRDLKPANILVDENGCARVIDFGVALAVGVGITGTPRMTQAGDLIGTPEYMSPEQAGGSPDIDTRTDVYALGVLLYELLTGQYPYELPSRGPLEILRVVQESDPRRPSHSDPTLRGDLETIVLKAIVKDRERRYASVDKLAQDIQSHLDGKPIEARRDSLLYLARKHLRRRWQSYAVVLVMVILSVTASLLVLDWRRQSELDRHRARVLAGRLHLKSDEPVNAERILHAELERYDDPGTRFAVWELFLKHPCLYHVKDIGRQTAVAFSHDGSWIGTVAADGRFLIFQAQTGHVVQTLPAESGGARSLVFGPEFLYVGGSNGVIRRRALSPTESPADTKEVELSPVLVGAVSELAMTLDGTTLAAGADSGEIVVIDVTNPSSSAVIGCWDTDRPVTGLAFPDDNHYLAASTEAAPHGGGVWVWDIARGELVSQHSGGTTRGVTFAGQSDCLFFGSGSLRQWPLDGDVSASLENESKWGVRAVDSSGWENGRYVAFAAGDGRVRFFDRRTRSLLRVRGYHDVGVAVHLDVALSPTGPLAASVGQDGLRLWSLLPAYDGVLPEIDGMQPEVLQLQIASNGEVVGVARYCVPQMLDYVARDQKPILAVFRWVEKGCVAEAVPVGPELGTGPIEFSPSGRRLLVCRRKADSSYRVDIAKYAEPDRVLASVTLDCALASTLWLEEFPPTLLLGLSDGRLVTWHPESAIDSKSLEYVVTAKRGSACNSIVRDPESGWLAACWEGNRAEQRPGSVALWRPVAGKREGRSFGHCFEQVSDFATHYYTWRVALTTAARRRVLVTAGSQRALYIWDPLTGEQLAELTGHTDAVHACVALGEGMLISGSQDGTARIWDLTTREEVAQLSNGNSHPVVIAACDCRVVLGFGGRVTDLEPPLKTRRIDLGRSPSVR
jgi:serine/threonine protein kinase/WD40 repeat protein